MGSNRRRAFRHGGSQLFIVALLLAASPSPLLAQTPTTTDPRLKIELVAQNLSTNFGDIASAWCFVDFDTLLVASRSDGTLRRLDLVPGQIVLPGAIVGDLPVIANNPLDDQSEFGVQSLVPHPDFATNHLLYVRYDRSVSPPGDTPQASIVEGITPMSNVIERLAWDPTANAGVGSLQPVPTNSIIRTSPVLYRYHHGGPMVFAPDGTLLVSYGNQRLGSDLAMNTSAFSFFQDVAVIVRVNDNGSIPVNNPFTPGPGVPANAAAWYAYGFRNIFGMAIDPLTGTLWCGDNGENSFDEINRVTPGTNSGSLVIAGPLVHPQQPVVSPSLRALPGSHYVDPAYSWLKPCGVTGIAFLHGSMLGPAFDDRLLVGNYNSNFVWGLRLNAQRDAFALMHPGLADKVDDRIPFSRNPVGTEAAETLLAANVPPGALFAGVIGVQMGPDGLAYLMTTGGRLYRITRACWCDIADDAGIPFTTNSTNGSNNGVNEGDYNAFFAGFFDAARWCDIADDAGNAPPLGPNNGINEGDYNGFFQSFFNGCN